MSPTAEAPTAGPALPTALRGSRQRYDFTNEATAAGLLLLLLALGALAMLPVSAGVVRLWTDDPLRSFGALLPLIAVALWVRRWRAVGWTADGTAWGLLPLVLAVLIARTYGSSLIAYSVGDLDIEPIQPGLLLFLYGSGVALLLGGARLWRAVLFPLGILLCVNPLPHAFERVDYPLQEMSANVARGFSHLLGLHPTGQQLQMMFAPRFGMVIVPGCNGVRGSATMAYLGLFVAYLRGYRWPRVVLYTLCGTALGYLLNLVRLCCLVVYYRLAVHHPEWRADGETVDYWIGGTLFLLLTTLAGFLLLRPEGGRRAAYRDHRPTLPARVDWREKLSAARWLVCGALLLAAAVTEVPAAWAMLAEPSDYIDPAFALAQMPPHLGRWTRGAGWTEQYDGHAVWQWAAYRAATGETVDIGLWLSPKRHFAIQSRRMSGSHPVAGGGFTATGAHGLPMQLSSFTLNDVAQDTTAAVPTFFAETMCLPSGCSEREVGFRRNGWVVAVTPMSAGVQRRLPMLYRVQAAAGAAEDAGTQEKAKALIREVTGDLEVKTLVETMGSR